MIVIIVTPWIYQLWQNVIDHRLQLPSLRPRKQLTRTVGDFVHIVKLEFLVLFMTNTLCASCRGVDCTLKDKCTECRVWTDEEFARYLKHRKSLVAKALSKSKNAGNVII